MAALVDRPDIDDSLDYEGILLDEALDCMGEPTLHRTRFAAVSRVPWGQALRVRPDGSTRLEHYWDPRTVAEVDSCLTLSDAAEILRERIDAAVRRLTPTDVRVGAHISGGLDSTAIAGFACRALRETGTSLAAAYSWAPSLDHLPILPGDERTLLDDVRAMLDIPIRTIDADGSGEWFWDLDVNRYPDSTSAREVQILPVARAEGVQVMLSGWGGDELASFNGRGVKRGLIRRGRFRAVWRGLAQECRVTQGVPLSPLRHARRFVSTVAALEPDLAMRIRHPRLSRETHRRKGQTHAALRAFSPLAAQVAEANDQLAHRLHDHTAYQLWLLTGGHLQHRTGWWYQTGRLFGIDYRYPLLDLGVVEAALTLPWWAFRSQGWGRVAFRLAVASSVPLSVAWNTDKLEPALFSLPVRPHGEVARRQRLSGRDARLDQVMELVDMTWESLNEDTETEPGVVSRPELAPKGRQLLFPHKKRIGVADPMGRRLPSAAPHDH